MRTRGDKMSQEVGNYHIKIYAEEGYLTVYLLPCLFLGTPAGGWPQQKSLHWQLSLYFSCSAESEWRVVAIIVNLCITQSNFLVRMNRIWLPIFNEILWSSFLILSLEVWLKLWKWFNGGVFRGFHNLRIKCIGLKTNWKGVLKAAGLWRYLMQRKVTWYS